MNKDLIYRYLQDSCTTEEKKTVQELLASDPGFKQEFEVVSAIFRISESYTQPVTADVEGQWNKFVSEKLTPVQSRKPIRWIWASGAAILAAIALVVVFLVNDKPVSEIQVYSGSDNGVIELADGSLIWLDKTAEVKLNPGFGAEDRDLTLTGSAFFKVSHDKSKPFHIRFRDFKVTVVGTEFEISGAGSPESAVRVNEGRVEVDLRYKVVSLGQGQVLEINDKKPGQLKTIVNLFEPSVPEWAGGNLQFNEQRLDVIVNAVASFYGIKIDIEDNLKNMVLTINLVDLDEKTALQTIATVTGLVLEKKDDRYSLKL